MLPVRGHRRPVNVSKQCGKYVGISKLTVGCHIKRDFGDLYGWPNVVRIVK
jgi:phosphoenolpyruvate carboxylase